jgi:hypothetical protein
MDQVDAETMERMRDYIQHGGQMGAANGVTPEDSFRTHEMSDEEVLAIVDQNGGYGMADGSWVTSEELSKPEYDDHIDMAPHGQWT